MSRPGTYLDRKEEYVYTKTTKALLNALGVDVSDNNVVNKSRWTKEDKEIAKKALTIVHTPCPKCGVDLALYFQDAGYVWCAECSNK